MNPFTVLNLSVKCTDEQVRHAYQDLLRRHPPETHPDQFQMIQQAYSSVRTERDRWRWFLLHTEAPAESLLDALERFSRLPGRARPPGREAFHQLLRTCADAARRDATPPVR